MHRRSRSSGAKMEKMNFDEVYLVFDAMHLAFHPDGNFDEIDDRLQSLWTLFLCSVGWTQEEFWSVLDSEDSKCEKCEPKKVKTNSIN